MNEDELKSALIEAHKAGNADHARVLAGELAKMQKPEMTAGEKATNFAGALVEPWLHIGSGGVASVAGGLAGLGAAANRELGFDTGEPGEVVQSVQEAMTYQPRTQGGKAETEWLTTPFRWLGEKSDKAGRSAAEYTGSPAYGAVTNAMVMAAPSLIGGIKNPYTSKNVATSMLKDVSGPRANVVKAALEKAPPEYTAGQAINPARSTETSALFKAGEKTQPSPYKRIHDFQQESSVGALDKIARPLAEREYMKRIRGGVSDNLYSAGRKGVIDEGAVANVVRDIDVLMQNNPGAPKLIAELRKAKRGLVDNEGNIRTNAQQVTSTVDGIRMTLKNKEFGPVEGQLNSLKKSIVELSPKYKAGDKFYAETSRPINQMDIANQLSASVKPKLGSAERASAYATAIDNAANTMKKATGRRPIKKELDVAMTPDQMTTINKVKEFLDAKADYKSNAALGMEKMNQITGASAIPKAHILDTAMVLFNAAIKRIEGKTSKAGMERIAELGKPENRAQLIEVLDKMTLEEKAALQQVLGKKAVKAGAIVGAEAGE